MKKSWLVFIAFLILQVAYFILYLGSIYYNTYIIKVKDITLDDIAIGMLISGIALFCIASIWYLIYSILVDIYIPKIVVEETHTLTRGQLHEIWQDGRVFEKLKVEKDSFEAFDEFLNEYLKNESDDSNKG